MRGGRAFLGLGLALAACASPTGSGQLTGSVSYRERIALPPGAVVRVTLLDVSMLDLPARVIAEQEIHPTGQVPVPFVLAYEGAAIDPEHRYALRATISDAGGRTLWATANARPVLGGAGSDPVQLLLQRVRGGAAPGGVRVLAYVCDGISFRAEVAEASVLLFLPGRSLRLAAVPSASGAKYEDGGSSFWSKGDEARLTLDGVGYGGCRLQSRPLP